MFHSLELEKTALDSDTVHSEDEGKKVSHSLQHFPQEEAMTVHNGES